MKKGFLTSLVLIVLLSIGSVSAYSITSMTNKIVYVINDPLTITGTVDTTGSVPITVTVYNSTGSTMYTSTKGSSSGSPNTFSFSSTINGNYTPGIYNITITDGTDSIKMKIRVISQRILLFASPINSGSDVINVSTNTQITTDNALGGNFTELRDLSETNTLHYGNYSIGGKLYHFVLVDQTNATVYDRLYIDDDKDFRLFNDTEDSGSTIDIEYQALKRGSVFGNGTFKYIVGEIERTTGDKLILWTKPKGKPPYSTSDMVNFIVMARNSTRLLSEGVRVDILNSTHHNITPTNIYNTDNFGRFTAQVNLSDISNLAAGTYIISLNESLGIMPFPVESFKLFVTTTDLSNNPSSDFAPNSKVRISIKSKDPSGPKNLDSFTANIYYPDGSTVSKTKNDFVNVSDGIYYYDLDLTDKPTGGYAISVTGSIGTDTQKASTGFEVQSIDFEADAINTKYVEEAEGPEAMVNAFAPNSNVTIMTFLSNISAGGIREKGPEGMTGLIPPGDCNSTVTLIDSSIKDENGDSYPVDYRSMNLSDALKYLYGQLPDDVPPGFLKQCMIIFPTPSKNGIYKAEVRVDYQGEKRYAGVTFGVQRLWAVGNTVDFKGEEFGFLAPNSTVRIKLKVTDLKTDEELPAANITSAKIIEMERVFPSYKDILANETLRQNLNESVVNGTISFTSPVDEGFYMMKFRFTAYVDGKNEKGIGDAFFMLKKYMVWGQLAGAEEGKWFVRQGKNITLRVTVLDIDKAHTYFGGYSSQKSCTGCSGFVVDVSEIRNDQQFKKVTEYTVQTGSITNTTNPVVNVTIIPSPDMQPGWYSADLVVTDTSTDATYFGWGWFEIRNFWVDIQAVDWNGSHYMISGEKEGPGGGTYGVGDDIEFTVIAREPFSPNILTQTSPPSVESVQWFVGWPPLPISGYSTSVLTKDIVMCFDFGECQLIPNQYVIKISNLPTDKQGDFQVNVKVTTDEGSDTGSFWFDISSFLVETDYRMNSWPPLFASTENFTVDFTAMNFDYSAHNITNVTIDDFFDEKRGRPIKMRYGKNYTTYCTGNNCRVDVNLTFLTSGEYFVRFMILDDQNNEKSAEAFFKIQNEMTGIPSLEEAWIWETDTVSKKIDNDVRRGEWTWCGDERETAVPNAITLCNDFCPEGPCQKFNLTVSNVSYEKEVFGYIPMMEEWGKGRFGSVANKSRMWMYANGSHMWINANPPMIAQPFWANLTGTAPIAVGDTFTDSKGGLWKLNAIGDQSITITGLNTLYKTGVLINTSYTKSGIIKLGQIEEEWLGTYTPEGRSGIDLNGDTLTNGTVYFAIADDTSSGVYDMFFFSTDGNFTGLAAPGILNPISVNDPDRTKREFGFGKNLTLLSIDARAQGLRFYSRQMGDWAHMGDVKLNSNVTIPVIVTSPDGTPKTATVSITGYKNMRNWKFKSQTLATKQITGVGELSFNSSLLGTGEYAFAIKTDETMEEWKWPMATIRGFLIDGEMGEATYVSNFKPLPLKDYRWDTPDVDIIRIQQDRRNVSNIVNGVLAHARPFPFDQYGCEVWDGITNITDTVYPQYPDNYTFIIDDERNHYYFYNVTSGVLYRNITDCWFNVNDTSQTTYNEGDTLILNKEGKDYNVSILRIDVYNYSDCGGGCWRVNFGVPGINYSNILPMVDNPYADPDWRREWGYMQNVSIFGTYYDVILANDTTDYQRCILEPSPDGQCAKKAWFVPTSLGNFSSPQAVGVVIGENFTLDLYLSAVGPNDGDGITVGNFSGLTSLSLSQYPGIGGIPFADDTTSYFTVLNETDLDMDLDKNGSKNGMFYMLTFDSDFNSKKNLTSNMIDDDLELLDWSLNEGGEEIYYDFTSNETYAYGNRTREQWCGLPTGTWSGCAQFGDHYPDKDWENQPDWNVPFYNTTDMLLEKSRWKVDSTQSVDVLLKIYDFDQTPIQGANVSIKKMARHLPWLGFQVLSTSNYTVDTTYNVTDSYGYSLLKVTHTTGTWPEGEYQIVVKVQAPQGTENWERWFCVGGCKW